MAGDRIERDVLIEAPIDVVWEVISRPEQIVHWFSDEAQLDLRPGGVLAQELPLAKRSPSTWPCSGGSDWSPAGGRCAASPRSRPSGR
jgi:hypothetical protein